MTDDVAQNGAAAAAEDDQGSPLMTEPSVPVPTQQDRLLFFASVLIGHKIEVQVRMSSKWRASEGRGRPGWAESTLVLCF